MNTYQLDGSFIHRYILFRYSDTETSRVMSLAGVALFVSDSICSTGLRLA